MFYLCSLFASITSSEIADCQFCVPELISPAEVYFKSCNYLPTRCNHIWQGFDILIWRACETGLSHNFGDVSITNADTGSTNTTTIVQTDKDIQFDWDLAFRASGGYEFATCNSNVGFYWTRFHQKTKTLSGINQAKWEIDFDTLDGCLSHRLWMDCCLDLQPMLGLRYAHIHQQLKVDLSTVYTSFTVTHLSTMKRDTQKFWGLGPLFGIQADWYFLYGWSIFGTVDGGVLYGHFKTAHVGEDSSSTIATLCHSEGNSCAAQFVLDLMFGIRWESQYVTLKMGLEHHRYANFNQIGCSGDLNLFGANCGLEIHY